MIIVRLMGGLGNQMFQYAFGKALALKHGVKLKLDISLLGENKSVKDLVLRNYDLDIFNLKDEFASDREIEKFNGKKNSGIMQRIIYKANRMLGKYPLVLQKDQEYDVQQINSIGSNACIVGRWQSEDYFKKFASEIRSAFSFDQFVPNIYSKELAVQMSKIISVSVHVRRGDYVTHPFYSRMLGCLDKQYYLDAIALMNEKIGDAETAAYYFISDDIDWCKVNFADVKHAVFVEQEKSKTGFVSDLWLMTQCRHAVISNSTFSWWGAWLAEKDGTIVIAPENWGRVKKLMPPNIIPNRWLKIKNEFLSLN